MKLDTIDLLTEELGKSLIDEHIYYTWHNKEDNTIETLPGKVLDCKDGKISIDTLDIFMLDNDTSLENNKMIKTYNIEDITDIYPFKEDEYNHDVLDMIKDIDETDYNNTLFDISYGNDSIKAIIVDINAPLSITLNISNEIYEYPLYLIKSIKNNNNINH